MHAQAQRLSAFDWVGTIAKVVETASSAYGNVRAVDGQIAIQKANLAAQLETLRANNQALAQAVTVNTPGVSVQPITAPAQAPKASGGATLESWWASLSSLAKVAVGTGAGAGAILLIKAIAK